MIDINLLNILCCPETKADLVMEDNRLVSCDKKTRRAYRIEDEIPVMLIEESTILDLDEWLAIMKKHGKAID